MNRNTKEHKPDAPNSAPAVVTNDPDENSTYAEVKCETKILWQINEEIWWNQQRSEGNDSHNISVDLVWVGLITLLGSRSASMEYFQEIVKIERLKMSDIWGKRNWTNKMKYKDSKCYICRVLATVLYRLCVYEKSNRATLYMLMYVL